MKKEKRVIQVIIKSGLITWVLLLLIWQTGSLFYSDDFLPGPVIQHLRERENWWQAESFPGYFNQYAAACKRLAAWRESVSDLHIKTLL